GELDCGFLQVAGMLLKLALEALEKRNGVGSGAREAGNHFVVVEAARFSRSVLHYMIAHGDLTIGDEHDFVVLAHAEHGGAVHPRILRVLTHPAIISHREVALGGAAGEAVASDEQPAQAENGADKNERENPFLDGAVL